MKEINLFYKSEIKVKRDHHGIPHIHAASYEDALYGQGYMEAHDRGMQMIFMRIISQGRIAELLNPSEDMLEADIFLRKLNFYSDAYDEAESMDENTRKLVNAWVQGVNDRFRKGLPFEIRLTGNYYEEWKIEDIIALTRMTGYLGLQQTQGQMERFIIEMIQAGIPEDFLNEMFPGIGGEVDFSLIRKIKISERNIPAELLWNSAFPAITGTNIWAVSPSRTESGRAILANDPHLDGNRLPNIWQEMSLSVGERYMMGFTMPGLPGILIGRTNDLVWGASYSFMDSIDSWIEDCREGKCRRINKKKDEWVRFRERRELFKRKRRQSKIVTFYENEHGTLDGDPFVPGLYLATKTSSAQKTGSKTIASMLAMFETKNVPEGKENLGNLEVPFTWVLADSAGNIGMQMSGLLPQRSNGTSGMYPAKGWESSGDWKGFVSPENLPSRLNPKEGYIIAANNDLNAYGKSRPVNLSMGEHRADRLEELLSGGISVNLRQMSEMQYDDYSIQAREIMSVLRPVLPDSSESEILKSWDCRYTADSEGARIFEIFYRYLLEEVFGKVLGEKTFRNLYEETRILVVGFNCFDRILLSPYSLWFGEKTREEIYLAAVLRAFRDGVHGKDKKRNKIPLKNILLGGNPLFFFTDRRAVRASGGRATISQLQSYRSEKRDLKLLPTFRMLCDFSQKGLFTNMIGGPVDRPLSRLYNSDTKNWLRGRYRRLLPGGDL